MSSSGEISGEGSEDSFQDVVFYWDEALRKKDVDDEFDELFRTQPGIASAKKIKGKINRYNLVLTSKMSFEKFELQSELEMRRTKIVSDNVRKYILQASPLGPAAIVTVRKY